MDIKTAIENGQADELWGSFSRMIHRLRMNSSGGGKTKGCLTHPLHYVSDMLFEGTLQRVKKLLLVDALIQAGGDLNFQSGPCRRWEG